MNCYVGNKRYTDEDILSGWIEHFKNLSLKNYAENFDTDFLNQVEDEVAVIYRICLDSCDDPQYVTDDKWWSAVC